jgi:uncharacterized membrane protein HdeD (DUF308 family)
MQTEVRKTWKPTTAGILNVISGVLSGMNASGFLILLIAVDTWDFFSEYLPNGEIPFTESFLNAILIVGLVFSIITAVFPIVGGICAYSRKRWGWSLVGSIISILAAFPLGILSTIFVAMSKDEFTS